MRLGGHATGGRAKRLGFNSSCKERAARGGRHLIPVNTRTTPATASRPQTCRLPYYEPQFQCCVFFKDRIFQKAVYTGRLRPISLWFRGRSLPTAGSGVLGVPPARREVPAEGWAPVQCSRSSSGWWGWSASSILLKREPESLGLHSDKKATVFQIHCPELSDTQMWEHRGLFPSFTSYMDREHSGLFRRTWPKMVTPAPPPTKGATLFPTSVHACAPLHPSFSPMSSQRAGTTDGKENGTATAGMRGWKLLPDLGQGQRCERCLPPARIKEGDGQVTHGSHHPCDPLTMPHCLNETPQLSPATPSRSSSPNC